MQNPLQDAYGLSPPQRSILLDMLSSDISNLYVEQTVSLLNGPLDLEALNRAWQVAVRRHTVLRTSFHWRGLERPLQAVHATADSSICVHEARGDDEHALQAVALEERGKPFDLGKPPLARLTVLALKARQYGLIFTYHHLILDGGSRLAILQDIVAAYNAVQCGALLENTPTVYKPFVQECAAADINASKQYWGNVFSPYTSSTPPPYGAGQEKCAGGFIHRHFTLDEHEVEALRLSAAAAGVTSYTLFEATWAALLSRLSRERAATFGRVLSIGGASPVDRVVGLRVNTIPAVVLPRLDATLHDFYKRVQASRYEALRHATLSIEEIAQGAYPAVSRQILSSVLAWDDFDVAGTLEELRDIESVTVFEPVSYTGFPLLLMVHEARTSLGVTLIGSDAHYDGTRLERLADTLRTALRHVMRSEPRYVWEIALVGDDEKRVLKSYSGESHLRAGSKTVHELFFEQAAKTPNATAIECDGDSWTYRQLEDRVRRLAARLMDLDLAPEARLGICLERTAWLPATMLAVMSAGAAYVPIDPTYPASFRSHCASDAAIAVLITDNPAHAREQTAYRVLVLSELAAGDAPQAREAIPNEPGRLAYILYTSGSTGKPKGVCIEHSSAAAFLRWAAAHVEPVCMQRVFATTSVCFDLSVFEIFATLSCGGTVVFVQNALAITDEHRATLLNTVPSALRALSSRSALPAGLRQINVAGEPLTASLAQSVFAVSNARLLNLYGPTEATTYATVYDVPRKDDKAPAIGRPISSCSVYVLDESLEPLPIGVAGEVYIGGPGVARGYWCKPSLTAERFVPDPFADRKGARLYRTGDIGWFDEQGDLHYVGRIDRQVKVHGYRIELGQIEHAALAHADVSGSYAMVDTENPEPTINLFVLPRTASAFSTRSLQESLTASLPRHMLPAAIHEVEAFPLLPNGKIDGNALLRRPATEPPTAKTYASTDTQRAIEKAWRTVLCRDTVPVDQNFFDLGGSSLKIFHLMHELATSLKRQVDIIDLYSFPTIQSFANHIDGADKSSTGAASSRGATLVELRQRRSNRV